MSNFACTPTPPYYAVIFSSQRTADDPAYDAQAQHMVALAQVQPGFLGVENTRDATGFGITVSYWESEAAIRAWKANMEHKLAQEQGRTNWYARYEVRVCKVERAYGFGAF